MPRDFRREKCHPLALLADSGDSPGKTGASPGRPCLRSWDIGMLLGGLIGRAGGVQASCRLDAGVLAGHARRAGVSGGGLLGDMWETCGKSIHSTLKNDRLSPIRPQKAATCSTPSRQSCMSGQHATLRASLDPCMPCTPAPLHAMHA
jgi:hypothetical protein